MQLQDEVSALRLEQKEMMDRVRQMQKVFSEKHAEAVRAKEEVEAQRNSLEEEKEKVQYHPILMCL